MSEMPDIPDFLRVRKEAPKAKGKKKDQPAPMPVVTVRKETKDQEYEDILSGLSPAMRAAIEHDIRMGTFNKKWLTDDPTILMLYQREKEARAERKKVALQSLKDRNEAIKATTPKIVKPKFGENTTIKLLAKKNPRAPGSLAFNRWAELEKWLKANPQGSVAEMLEYMKAIDPKRQYRKIDFECDLKKRALDTVLINGKPAPAPVPVPAADKPSPVPVAAKPEPKPKSSPVTSPAKPAPAKGKGKGKPAKSKGRKR